MLNSMRGGHAYKKLTIKENSQVSDVYKNQDDKLILQTLWYSRMTQIFNS